MRRNTLLNSPFQGIGRAMTGCHDVEVRFGGTGPKTNGRIVYLPANADELPGHDQESLHGWTDHEFCHIEEERLTKDGAYAPDYTSPLGYQTRAMKMGKSYALLHNVYEDVRIENKKSKSHPGVAENLSMINERSIKRYQAGAVKDVWQNIAGAIIATCRRLDTSWIAGGTAVVMGLIADEVKAADVMKTPKDAFELAVLTANKLKDLAEQTEQEQERREQEPEDGDGDGDGEPEDGDDEGEGSEGSEGSDDEEGDEDGDGDGDDEGDDSDDEDTDAGDDDGDDEDSDDDGDGDDQDGDGANGDENGDEEDGKSDEGAEDGDSDADSDGDGDGDDGEPEDGSTGDQPGSVGDLDDGELEELTEELGGLDEDPDVTDFINHIKDEIQEAAAEDAGANQRVIAPLDVCARDGFEDAPEGDLGGYLDAKADVEDQIGALKRKLSTVLRARRQTYFQGDKDDGMLDAGALHGLKTGNTRVFAQRTVADSNFTAITLLVDLSGSMAGRVGRTKLTRAYYAQRTAIALAETLEAVGVPFEVLGFHNDANPTTGEYYIRGTSMEQWSEKNGGATRHCPFRIRPFKLFTDSLRRVRPRFAAMEPSGHNGDGDALMFAAKRLAQRPESRKLLIVISDGQPDGPAPSHLLRKQLHEVIKSITAAGIETYGVGAGFEGVREYYCAENGAESIVINDLTQLAVSVFKLIRSRLLARKLAS